MSKRILLSQSFTEKLGSLMQRPGQENAPKDDIPWWLKYAGRAAGSAGGVRKYNPSKELQLICFLFSLN